MSAKIFIVDIRQETVADFKAVEAMTRASFWNLFQPGSDEHFLIHKLRQSTTFIPELTLVATIPITLDLGSAAEEEVVGQITYTRSSVLDEKGTIHETVTFGPIAVSPSHQKLGIGGKLIARSVEIATSMGFAAIIIYGHPFYYSKFGFANGQTFGITSPNGSFPKALQVLELYPGALHNVRGVFHESPDFDIDPAELSAYDESFPPQEKFVTVSQHLFREMVKLKYDDPDPIDAIARSRCLDRA